MERCPNCGELVRGGARYCTTCGYRMPEESDAASIGTANDGSQPPDPASSGWPDYAPPGDASAAPMSDDATESTGQPADRAESESSSASFWPTPPVAPGENASMVGEVEEPDPVIALASVSVVDESEPSDESPPRDRLLALIDEVRELVATMPNEDRDDLRGVVAELEVASTSPGAFDPEDLASLRDALLSARDRPRDLDTALDLAGRIDSMIALVFAYERAHAAIERALDVLRRD